MVLGVVLLLLVAGSVFYITGGGITGAVIGVPEVGGGDVEITARCGGATACSCGNYVDASYTFTDDITGCGGHGLIINASDITIDCANYQIRDYGFSTSAAFYNFGNDNVTIKNCRTEGFQDGFDFAARADNNTLINNTINLTATSDYAFRVANSNGNNFTNNTIYYKPSSFPFHLSNANNSRIYLNNVTGRRGRGDGVTITGSSYYTRILNNTFYHGDEGVQIGTSYYTMVSNNTFFNNTNGVSGAGARSFSWISDNRITNSTGSGISFTAVNTYNETITRNEVHYNALTVGNTYNIYIEPFGAKNITVSFNNISWATAGAGTNLYLRESGGNFFNNWTIENNTMQYAFRGIDINSAGKDNVLQNNVIKHHNGSGIASSTGSVRGAIFLDNRLVNNTIAVHTVGEIPTSVYFANNTLINGTYGFKKPLLANMSGGTISGFEVGIILDGITNQTYTHMTLTNNTLGVKVNGSSNNNSFTTFTFENNTNDIHIVQDGGNNNSVVNLTGFNLSKLDVESGSSLYIRWFVKVNVTNTTGHAIPNVSITAKDVTNVVDRFGTTQGDGLTTIELADSYLQDYTRYIITNNHTVVVSKGGYTKNSSQFDLRLKNNTILNYTITEVACGKTLYTDFELGQSLSSNGTCLTIGGDDVFVDGRNYTISGIGVNPLTAIYAVGRNTFNLTNVRIRNFSKGIHLYGTNNSNLRLVRAENNTYGIFFNYSTNNTVYDSYIPNATIAAVAAAEGKTNNSLFNVTTSNINPPNLTIIGSASLFKGWEVAANITINASTAVLGGANVSIRINDSTLRLDTFGVSASDGFVRLFAKELEQNSSGLFYFTSNVTASFVSSLGNATNGTTINLSKTNSTQVNLSLRMPCTAPSGGMTLSGRTVLCPGTYTITDVDNWPSVAGIGNSAFNIINNATVVCSNTVIKGPTWGGASAGTGFAVANNVTISNCNVSGFENSIRSNTITNLTINNSYFEHADLRGTNFYFTNYSGSGVYLASSNNFTMEKSTIQSGHIGSAVSEIGTGITIVQSTNITIRNSTFNNLVTALDIQDSGNLSVYYNTFDSVTSNYFKVTTNGNLSLNTTVSAVAQGNDYDETCDMTLTDADSDGWYDSGADYPFNETTSAKISNTNSEKPIDYGPKVRSCTVEEVQLGSGGGGGGGGSSSGDAAGAAAAPAAPSQGVQQPKPLPPPAPPIDQATVTAEVDNVRTTGNTLEGDIVYTSDVSGTGRHVVELNDKFPFLRHLRTFSTALSQNTPIQPTKNSPSYEVVTHKTEADKTFEIKQGEQTRVPFKISLAEFTLDESVDLTLEIDGVKVRNDNIKITKPKTVSGKTFVEHVSKDNVLNMFVAVINDELRQQAQQRQQDSITGAVVTEPMDRDYNEYTYEVVISETKQESTAEQLAGRFFLGWKWWDLSTKRRVVYAEAFPSLKVKNGESFIFAQQLGYDPSILDCSYDVQSILSQDGIPINTEWSQFTVGEC